MPTGLAGTSSKRAVKQPQVRQPTKLPKVSEEKPGLLVRCSSHCSLRESKSALFSMACKESFRRSSSMRLLHCRALRIAESGA